jgi:lipoprotein-anchoring transpeptidase ErfK/SrfK
VRHLVDPSTPRTIGAPTRAVAPHLTSGELAQRYSSYIVVDRGPFQLKYYRHLKLAKTYRIAVGQQGLETPAGLYDIQSKQVNPVWQVPNSPWAGALAGRTIPPGPEDPLKARWMGFDGSAGIHGTEDVSSLGTAASHGCIRMAVPDVEQLYAKVQVHTPVYII